MFFDGLRQTRTDEQKAKYRRENSDLYIPLRKRFGPKDPDPLEYIIELPKPSVFERDHNQMWLRAEPYRRSRFE